MHTIFLRYNRGWFYHRELRLWFTRIPNMEPLVKTPDYERGSYGCFDPHNWETVRKVWSCKFVVWMCILSYALLQNDS
jgi:CCR4-NOT transcriptional regulation complex NOT5 subunit